MTLADIQRYDPDGVAAVGDRAVVVGGSMAGLCAARVLADGFDEVVVIERDRLPDEPVARDGAPQTSHPHVLLEGGRATLEDLFPGFSADVLADGGLMVDTSTEIKGYNHGGFLSERRERLPTYCASRALVESVVRRHVRGLDAVRLRDGCQFTDYLTDSDASTVTGVAFYDGEDGQTTLAADLVVDATGRTSRTPSWLERHGYDAPPVDEVTIDIAYSTLEIERPSDDRRVFNVFPSAPRTRGAAALPVEGGRWEVMVQGVHGDDPPTDPEGLVEFAKSLPVSEIGRLLETQPWVSDEVHRYPYPSSLRRRYERLDRFPDGLVVTGDAVASFNPVYGQGMSVAALDAVLLHHALADGGLDDLPARFFDRTEDLLDDVWQVVVGSDFQFPQTTGPKPRGTDLTNWYTERLVRRAHSDPVLSEAFARVARLEKPPSSLVRPDLAWRTLRPSAIASVQSLATRAVSRLP